MSLRDEVLRFAIDQSESPFKASARPDKVISVELNDPQIIPGRYKIRVSFHSQPFPPWSNVPYGLSEGKAAYAPTSVRLPTTEP